MSRYTYERNLFAALCACLLCVCPALCEILGSWERLSNLVVLV